jgi:transposase
VACTHLLTCYFLGGRSMRTFDAFVFPDLSGAVLVHDRYQNYDAIPGVLYQLCCAHILRDLEDAAQAYPDAIWPGQAADALRALIHAANTARAQGLAAVPAEDTAVDLRLFRSAVRVGLSGIRRAPGANTKQRPGRLLLECLDKREPDVLRFLGDLRVPPTSNQAERDLRPAKTQQKISGRLRSETAARHRYWSPRLHSHRRKTRRGHHHRHSQRARRKPLDATHPRMRITLPASSNAAQTTIAR